MIVRVWNGCVLLVLLLRPLSWAQTLHFDNSDLYTSVDSTTQSLSRNWDIREGHKEWGKINIPSDLNRIGQYNFRTYFNMDSTVKADLYKLYFQGVDGNALFYLNKKIIGGHTGGQAIPFSFHVRRESLYPKEYNELFIELDSRLNFHNTIPLKSHYYGLPAVSRGIYGNVEFFPVQRPYVSNLTIQRSANSTAVECSLELQAPQKETDSTLNLIVQIYNDFSSTILWRSSILVENSSSEKSSKLAFSIPADVVQSWSPDSPNLYRLKMSLNGKSHSFPFPEVTFGLCNVELAHNLVYINGIPKHLKIIEWVQDHVMESLSGDSLRVRIHHDLVAIKQLGANAVRVFPCSPHSVFYDECDRLGLLVLVDSPLLNIPSGLLTEDLANSASELLTTLVRSYRYHPCIIAWGLGSGYDAGSPEARDFLEKLKSVVRENDDRSVYAGKRGHNKLKMHLPVDLEIIELEPQEVQKIARDTVNIVADGAEIFRLMVPLNWIGRTRQSAERDQAFILSIALKHISFDNNMGVLVSPLRDWYANTPFSMWQSDKDTMVFYAGLLDNKGQKRTAYNIVQARLNHAEVPTILPTEEINDENFIFQFIGFGILIVFLIFFRSNRQLRNYLRRIFLFPHGFYIDIAENRHVNFFLTILVGVTSLASIAVIAASFFYYIRTNLVFDEILTWLCLSAQIKLKIIWLIWNPVFFIIVVILFLLLITILQSFVFSIFIFFQKRYLKWLHSLIFVFWVPANLLFSIPLAVVCYRLLNNSEFDNLIAIGLLIIFVWLIIRMLRGMVILLQLSEFKSLIIFIVTFIVFAGGLLYYLDHSRSIIAFCGYWWSLF